VHSVSVIVPAYNEEATILGLLGRVSEQQIDGAKFEVLVVDDGSTDGTVRLLEKNPGLYAKLVKRPRNGGKGAAVRDGLREATGDYVLFQDADLEYDPADYGKLLKPVLDFDADIVMGSRLVASPCTRVSYFWHKLGNKFITFVFNILNNTTFTDVYSCYLLYRRDLVAADELVTEGWEQHAEILSRAVAKAKSMYEVPINYYGRTYEEGKKIRAHHALVILWTMLVRRIKG
jgi:glycosyltransferase involved in cell wall biosynthesis